VREGGAVVTGCVDPIGDGDGDGDGVVLTGLIPDSTMRTGNKNSRATKQNVKDKWTKRFDIVTDILTREPRIPTGYSALGTKAQNTTKLNG